MPTPYGPYLKVLRELGYQGALGMETPPLDFEKEGPKAIAFPAPGVGGRGARQTTSAQRRSCPSKEKVLRLTETRTLGNGVIFLR